MTALRSWTVPLAVAAATLLVAACSNKQESSAGGGAGGSTKASTTGGVVTLKDGGEVKIALVPGGPHPYFQPWKSAGAKAKDDFGLGGTVFNETSQWDQGKQNSLLDSL